MKRRDDLSKPLLSRVLEAIEKGDKAEAKAAAEKMWNETTEVRQITAELASSMITYIARELGEEKVYDAWAYIGNEIWRPRLAELAKLDHEQVVDTYALVMRGLGSDFFVEEGEDKTVVTVTACGSAGRLRKEGKCDNTDRCPTNCGTTKKAHPWSFNKTGMTYYCVHAPVWFNMLPEKWGVGKDLMVYETWGRQFNDAGDAVNEPCRVVIRKQQQAS